MNQICLVLNFFCHFIVFIILHNNNLFQFSLKILLILGLISFKGTFCKEFFIFTYFPHFQDMFLRIILNHIILNIIIITHKDQFEKWSTDLILNSKMVKSITENSICILIKREQFVDLIILGNIKNLIRYFEYFINLLPIFEQIMKTTLFRVM